MSSTKKRPYPLIIPGCGLFLFARRSVRGLSCLAVFLVVVTFWMHNCWADSDPNMKMMNMVNFMKNMALLGAVLMMYSFMDQWPWVLAL